MFDHQAQSALGLVTAWIQHSFRFQAQRALGLVTASIQSAPRVPAPRQNRSAANNDGWKRFHEFVRTKNHDESSTQRHSKEATPVRSVSKALGTLHYEACTRASSVRNLHTVAL
jgi:hypothetical protein